MYAHTKCVTQLVLNKCHYVESCRVCGSEKENMNAEEKSYWGQLGRVCRGIKYSSLGLLSGWGKL